MENDSQIFSENVALLRKEASDGGLVFSTIYDKLDHINRGDPSRPKYIWSYAYDSGARPGQKLRHIIYLRNPFPKWEHHLHVTYFIGFPNFDNLFQSWVHRDTRWPDWTTGPFDLEANAQKLEISYAHVIPNVPPSSYNSMAILWRSELGMESYLDFNVVSLNVLPK